MTRKLLLLLALSSLAVFSNAIAYDGYKVYELTPSTAEQANLLHDLSQRIEALDFFSLSKIPQKKAHVLVPPTLEAELVVFLEQHKIAGHVLNSNFGEELSRDFDTNLKLRKLAAATAGRGRLSTERYYSYDEIVNYSADLAARYPSRVFLKNVGKSYEGRIMQTLTISNGDGRKGKNVIFVDCGFHAREWISPAMGLYLLDQLVENYEQNADLLLDYDWQIMLLVNPDGYDHSMKSSTTRLWRKTRQPHQYLGRTCYGTDPNRNFPFHWMEGGASSVPCLDTFAGPTPFSDPETIVVRDVLNSLKGRGIMYLTLHSHGYYLLYPWGWTEELPEDWRSLDEVARAGGDAIYNATGSVYSVGSSTTVLYIAAGASDDWAYSIGFPISITMELPSGGSSGFDPPPAQIDPFVKETWIGIRAMAEKVIEKYPTERNNFL